MYGEVSVHDLLAGYLSNDIELQKQILKQENALFSNKAKKIENTVLLSLATGTVQITSNSGNANVSFTPKAELTLPVANNLSIAASSDVKLQQNDNSVSNTCLTAEVDILSPSNVSRKVSLLNSEREVVVANRNVLEKSLAVEREFYNDLKSLYNYASLIAQAEKELYDAKLSFEQTKVKGYSSSSQMYRKTELEVLSKEHTAKTRERELQREITIFFEKCGLAKTEVLSWQELLPKTIPDIETLDIHSFKKENFEQIENATWQNYINTMQRKANSQITLKANTGYTFANEDTKSDSVNLGASLGWSGLSASAGVDIPTANKTSSLSPAYKFSLGINPLAFVTTNLSKKQQTNSAKQEELDIALAQAHYETLLIEKTTSLENILWNKNRNEELFNLYKTLALDNEKYFTQGLISESDYRSSLVNKMRYEYEMLSNQIELILYNSEIKSLFYDE
ncbi:MAG: hypothetical protein IKI31_07225 [Treponema sp.]|nr:hypothetical protein [Treponema sp.]